MMNFNLAMRNMLTGMALLFFAFVATTASAQCPAGNVTLQSQADVNAFGVNYPNCTTINGTLALGIGGATNNITDLTPLSGLTKVNDAILIYNTQLTNVNGFANITDSVNGIIIYGNTLLANLNGLNNINKCRGDLIIENNIVLTDLSGLGSIVSVGGILKIAQNNALTSLTGLNITSLNRPIYIASNQSLTDISALQNASLTSMLTNGLTITNNPALALCNLPNFCTYLANPAGTHPRTISGNATNCISEQAVTTACQTASTACPTGDVFLTTQAEVNSFGVNYPNCTTIDGILRIGVNGGNTDITNLSPLSSITTINFSLQVYGNSQLQSLQGLNNLQNVDWQIRLEDNGSLQSIAALANVSHLNDDLVISENTVLQNIDGFSGLTNVGGDIWINDNDALQNLNGLSNVSGTVELLEIRDNAALQNLNGLAGIDKVNAGLFITTNAALTNLSGFDSLKTVGDEFRIQDNASLQTINGFVNLTDIGKTVWISDHAVLQNINGLSKLSNIGGALNIDGNAALQNLNGLSNLTTISEDIYLENNAVLTDVSALQNTAFTPFNGYGLTLSNNTLLEVCNYPNFCAYIANDATTHPRIIGGNATTCATEQALQAACLSIGINDVDKAVVNTYPNPVKDVLNINADQAISEVAVMNMLGQTVIAKTVNAATTQVDMTALPAGNYFVKITTANGTQVGKVTKQ